MSIIVLMMTTGFRGFSTLSEGGLGRCRCTLEGLERRWRHHKMGIARQSILATLERCSAKGSSKHSDYSLSTVHTTTAHRDSCDCLSCSDQEVHTSSMVGKSPACTNSVLQSPDPCTVAANLPRRAFPNQLSGPRSDAHTAAPAPTARSKATVGKVLSHVWVAVLPIGSHHIFSARSTVLSRYSQR
jgi:hypothetical protein